MKLKDPRVRYAYEYQEDESSGLDRLNGIRQESQFERVFVQTAQMRRNYELYSDTVFMDATYAVNPYRMPLVVLSGVNSEGKNCIMGYAIVQRETLETYAWVL